MPTDARLGIALGVTMTLLLGLVLAARANDSLPARVLTNVCKMLFLPIQDYLPAQPLSDSQD
ncbi:hypothetical protein HRbin36_02620 [bacterium HR36]|nr:hypothetical protein HRbin36_02620 [bacterium HR36]